MPQVSIVMPKMSMTMTEGELLTWHVKVGDVIKLGDVVCEVATDKIDMEVEATAAGTVLELRGNPGDVMDVGTPLIIVDAESDDLLAGIFDAPAPAPVAEAPVAAPAMEAPAAAVAPPAPVAPTILNERPLATPHARAEAAALQVDLRTVEGSGADGVIKVEDVELAATATPERTIEARLKTRRAIARALEAARDIPSFSMTFIVDAPAALPTGADRTAALVTAWANTVRAFPELHADWNNGDLVTFSEVKVALSVMAPHGVVTPVVPIASSPTPELADRLAQIIGEAAKNHVAVEHLTASTTGFVDLGSASVVAATGLLVRPQSLALAVGAATGNGLTITITADHRIADPADLVLVARRFARELFR